jgi:tRNA(Ile)-lysidine synthase
MISRVEARPRATGAASVVDLGTSPEHFTPTWLAARLRALIGPLRNRQLAVAFSGGLDSTALLAALARLRSAHRLVLRAVHVDHGLHPDSTRWARHAAAQARRLRVRCRVVKVSVHAGGDSLEAAARRARYAALAQQLTREELLLTAHHQEDQFETVLLALMRGSGIWGLGAIPDVSNWEHGLLVRPLLPVSRMQLERYVAQRGLGWVDDPSNDNERFDRNYLRQRVLPPLLQRWPAAATTVGRSAAHLREARALLEQLAERTLGDARDGATLRVSVLARLPLAQRRNALRVWIGQQGLAAPDYRRLREIAGPMLAARSDALPAVRWRGGELRRFDDRLFALRAPPARPTDADWPWSERHRLEFDDGSALALVRERHGDVALSALPVRLQVRFRRGGEQLQGASGRVPLKQLLQLHAIPPWERAGVPLVADGERVIAVADLWLHPAYRAAAKDRERGRFRWRRVDG